MLILDGVYLSGRTNVVLIARDLSNVHAWHFADRESFAAWNAFFCASRLLARLSSMKRKACSRPSYIDFRKHASSDVWCMLNALSALACQEIPRPKQVNSSGIWCARSGRSGLKNMLDHGFSSSLHGRSVMRDFWLNVVDQLKRVVGGIPIEN